MTDSELMNIVTSNLSWKFSDLSIDPKSIKWPNTVLDQSDKDRWFEVKVIQTLKTNVTLSKTSKIFGTVIISYFSPIGEGNGEAVEILEKIAPALSKKLIQNISFDSYELVQLDHTLSQTQTTTDISHNQVNLNIDYSYLR